MWNSDEDGGIFSVVCSVAWQAIETGHLLKQLISDMCLVGLASCPFGKDVHCIHCAVYSQALNYTRTDLRRALYVLYREGQLDVFGASPLRICTLCLCFMLGRTWTTFMRFD